MSIPINKTLEDVRNDLFAKITDAQKDGQLPQMLNLNKGVVRGLIEIWAWGLFQLYQFLQIVLKQVFIESATGLWLELLCRIVDITRKPSTRASGHVHFYRASTSGNVPIPKNRIVKTLPDGMGRVLRLVTTEDAILNEGMTSVAVPVVAEEYGTASNVTVGQITEIATTIPGVDGVENRESWLVSEGADLEEDESLRARYILKWRGNNGCTKYAYEGWARSVPGVLSAKILDQHPRGQGTVDVIVRGTAGIPTEKLITAVDAVVQEEIPVNDDALVRGPGMVNVALSGTLELISGDPSKILHDVENRLRALFSSSSLYENIKPFGIGEDVMMDRMISVVMAVPGIKRIVWASPLGDIPVPEDGLPVLESLNFNTTWAESE
jgi:uncharacterized phage protein gp47/JayE